MKDYNLCPICQHTPAFCYHLVKAGGGYIDLGITRAEKYAREDEIRKEEKWTLVLSSTVKGSKRI